MAEAKSLMGGPSDDQRKGLLLGAGLSALMHGLAGRNPLAGGLSGYAQGLNSIYDRQKQELEQQREQENLLLKQAQFEFDKNKIVGVTHGGVAGMPGYQQTIGYTASGDTRNIGAPEMTPSYIQAYFGAGGTKKDPYQKALDESRGKVLQFMKMNRPDQMAQIMAAAQGGDLSSLAQSDPESYKNFMELMDDFMQEYGGDITKRWNKQKGNKPATSRGAEPTSGGSAGEYSQYR